MMLKALTKQVSPTSATVQQSQNIALGVGYVESDCHTALKPRGSESGADFIMGGAALRGNIESLHMVLSPHVA